MKQFFCIGILLLSAALVHAQDAAQKINQANQALAAQKYSQAFDLYDAAMKNLGDVKIDPSINYNIGYAAYRAEKYKEAIPYLDKAIAAKANVAKAWEYKGNAYSKMNDNTKAVDCYKKAASIATEGQGELIYNAGIAAYKGSMFDQAAQLFGQAADKGFKAETALYLKAMALKKQNKKDEYKQALLDGVQKFPNDKRLSSTLANEYVTEGNDYYQKGVDIMTEANAKVKAGTLKTTDAAYTSDVNKAKAQFKAAVPIIEKAVQLDPTNDNASKLLDACKQNLTI